MGNKRHKPEEIVTKLRQVEVLVDRGMERIDAIREVRIMSRPTTAGASSMAAWELTKCKSTDGFKRKMSCSARRSPV